jgi:hypothetical protein
MILGSILQSIKSDKPTYIHFPRLKQELKFLYNNKPPSFYDKLLNQSLERICKEDDCFVVPSSTKQTPTYVIFKGSECIQICKVIETIDDGYLCCFWGGDIKPVKVNRFMMLYLPRNKPSREELFAERMESGLAQRVRSRNEFPSHLSNLLLNPLSLPTNNVVALDLGSLDEYSLSVLFANLSSVNCKVTYLKVEFNQTTRQLFSFISRLTRSPIRKLVVVFTNNEFNFLPDECFQMVNDLQSPLRYLFFDGYIHFASNYDLLHSLERPTLLKQVQWRSHDVDTITRMKDFNGAKLKEAILEIIVSSYGRVGINSFAKKLPKDLQRYLKTFL